MQRCRTSHFKCTKMLKLFTFSRNVRFKSAIQWGYRLPSAGGLRVITALTKEEEEDLTNSIQPKNQAQKMEIIKASRISLSYIFHIFNKC